MTASRRGWRRAGLVRILLHGQPVGEFRKFSVNRTVETLIQAIDRVASWVATDPGLDHVASAPVVAELFPFATRKDA